MNIIIKISFNCIYTKFYISHKSVKFCESNVKLSKSIIYPPLAMWFSVVRRRWQQRKSDARNVRKFHNGGSQNQIYVQSIVYYAKSE